MGGTYFNREGARQLQYYSIQKISVWSLRKHQLPNHGMKIRTGNGNLLPYLTLISVAKNF